MSERFGIGVSVTTSFSSSILRVMNSPSVARGDGTPRHVWRFAPPRAAYTRTTRLPVWASTMPMFAVISDLPMPPLPPPIAQICRREVAGAGTASELLLVTSGGEAAAPSPSGLGSATLVLQLDVPVRGVHDVEERLPRFVRVGASLEPVERAPFGAARRLDEAHARLLRRASTLLTVALDARADDVLPRGAAAMGARNHVVEVELALGIA